MHLSYRVFKKAFISILPFTTTALSGPNLMATATCGDFLAVSCRSPGRFSTERNNEPRMESGAIMVFTIDSSSALCQALLYRVPEAALCVDVWQESVSATVDTEVWKDSVGRAGESKQHVLSPQKAG